MVGSEKMLAFSVGIGFGGSIMGEFGKLLVTAEGEILASDP